jgi:hypothetical protein
VGDGNGIGSEDSCGSKRFSRCLAGLLELGGYGMVSIISLSKTETMLMVR